MGILFHTILYLVDFILLFLGNAHIFQDICDCIEPCQRRSYSSLISYASLSPISIQKIYNFSRFDNITRSRKNNFIQLRARRERTDIEVVLEHYMDIEKTLRRIISARTPRENRHNEWLFNQIKVTTQQLIEVIQNDVHSIIQFYNFTYLQGMQLNDFKKDMTLFKLVIVDLSALIKQYKYMKNYEESGSVDLKGISLHVLQQIMDKLFTAQHLTEGIIEAVHDTEFSNLVCFQQVGWVKAHLSSMTTTILRELLTAENQTEGPNTDENLDQTFQNITREYENILTKTHYMSTCYDDYDRDLKRSYYALKDFYFSEIASQFDFDSYLDVVKRIEVAGPLQHIADRYKDTQELLINGMINPESLSSMCLNDTDYTIGYLEDYFMQLSSKATDPLFTYFHTLKSTIKQVYNGILNTEQLLSSYFHHWGSRNTRVPQMRIWKDLQLEFSHSDAKTTWNGDIVLQIKNFNEFYRIEGPARLQATMFRYFDNMERKIIELLSNLMEEKRNLISLFNRCTQISKAFRDIEVMDDYFK